MSSGKWRPSCLGLNVLTVSVKSIAYNNFLHVLNTSKEHFDTPKVYVLLGALCIGQSRHLLY